MIKELTDKDIGKWVFYDSGVGEKKRGKIKSYSNEFQLAWIVYKANDNWDVDHWKDYTAAGTKYSDLFFK